MKKILFSSRSFWKTLKTFCAAAEVSSSLRKTVSSVIEEVRSDGDSAIRKYIKKFDRADVKPGCFRVSPEELKEASRRCDRSARMAIRESLKGVEEFHKQCLPKNWTTRNIHGALVGERYYPLERVGIYIPKGLVSTVVMTCGLAKVAKVPEVAVFTPCDEAGTVSDGVLAALHIAGVKEVYRIGGIPAVAAMAYGTASIKPVLKVFGPGNAYVVEAKRQVYGQIGVDLLPGPSEVMLIADDTAEASFAAADLLAQAEHGSGREKIYFVGLSESIVKKVHDCLREQLKTLPRKTLIASVLKNGFLTILVDSLEAAAEVANYVAPEHLELEVEEKGQEFLTRLITTAGAIMQGKWSATALGDFTAGPSHELPTGGAGRFSSGLRVEDFMRRSSVIRYDKKSLSKAASVVGVFSQLENLDAHGRSVEIRLEKK
ncbi:MAG: histidinol dehydrogenase [Opitutaceae bacterium]|nr:histidinol dehydrogenase [Opitutaceae bacterium]